MTRLLIVTVTLLAVVAVVLADEEQICNPGARWREKCNRCWCGEDGKTVACSLALCTNRNYPNRARRNIVLQPRRTDCVPNTTFQQDCNTCRCGPDGKTAACTLKACVSIPPQARRKRETCVPGSTFKRDCNICRCSNDGTNAACTLMACIPPQGRQKRAPRDGERCEPGVRYMDECNLCICSQDGIKAHASCTINICRRSKRETESCTPGSTFQRDCNTCTCAADGRSSVCTLKLCVGSTRQKRETCTPGTTFKRDCNTCRCSADGQSAACTLRLCINNSNEPSDIQDCEPGTYWNEDCNNCFCTPNGHAACTLKACLKEEPRQKRDTSNINGQPCQLGETKKQDCNTCFCTPGGFACTRMACVKYPVNVRPTKGPTSNQDTSNINGQPCQLGETKKQDCNTCFCTPGGFACTRMACVKYPVNDRPTKGPTSNQDVPRCVPGTSFYDGCNTCSCTENGHEVCTQRACLPPIVEERRDSLQCVPGTSWYNGCNSCSCTESGRKICTMRACPPPHVKEKRDTFDQKCKDGDRWKHHDGCNTCFCSPDGYVACTLMACESLPSFEIKELPVPIAPVPQDLLQCEPGSTWNDGCNECVCSSNGLSYACTRKHCSPSAEKKDLEQLHFDKRDTTSLNSTNNTICNPGAVFNRGCNTCWCSRDGSKLDCTDMECAAEGSEEDGGLEFAERCDPGGVFLRDCNICICAVDGIAEHASCTIHSCTKRGKRDTTVVKQNCQPGKWFKQDCNYCRCKDDGKSFSCTEMACPTDIPQSLASGKLCEPGTTFRQDCNTCRCSFDGLSAVCTLKACVTSPTKSGVEEQFCEPGKSFSQDCNTCRCSQNGKSAICTLKACPQHIVQKRDIEFALRCDPGSVFTRDCNICICGTNGIQERASCTIHICRRRSKRDVEAENCEPGKTFKKDCNICRCNNDGTSSLCTKRNCLSPDVKSKDTKHVCEPGSTFRRDCNLCRCSADGLIAACTKRKCLLQEVTQNEEEEQHNDNNEDNNEAEVCEPKSIFKIDCNTCRCSSNGLTYACTKLPCGNTVRERRVPDIPEDDYNNNNEAQVCEPRSTFKIDCNTCRCSSDGLTYGCTRLHCRNPIREKREDDYNNNNEDNNELQVCEPRSTFKIDCNTCRCSSDGLTYACTRLRCRNLVRERREDDYNNNNEDNNELQVCEPRSTFKIDCNTCRCSSDGLTYACTRLRCRNLVRERREDDYNNNNEDNNELQVCEPRSTFKIDCNTCRCSSDGLTYACTRLRCRNLVRERRASFPINEGCVPGSSWKEDCNTCYCSLDGYSGFCTLKDCEDSSSTEETEGNNLLDVRR